jgi:hypothetical protein
MKCQLPAGTYTIGAQYIIPGTYSLSDQYVTADFQNGHHYALSYDYINLPGLLDKWELKLLEKD